MDCGVVERDLVAYAFATASAETADAIDAHLLACQACLRAYLGLRRSLAYAPEVRPSAAAHARLRAEVLETFGPRRRLRRIGSVAAVAGVVASITAVVVGVVQTRARHEPAPPAGRIMRVDSARPAPASGSIY